MNLRPGDYLAGLVRELVKLQAEVRHVTRGFLTNASLRERFGVEKKNKAMVSRYIREAVSAGMIRPFAEDAARSQMKYVPFWA